VKLFHTHTQTKYTTRKRWTSSRPIRPDKNGGGEKKIVIHDSLWTADHQSLFFLYVREREETTKKNSSRSHSLTLTLSPFAPFWVCIVSDMLRTQPSSNITDYIGGKKHEQVL
jgi:hypothetical protein